MSMSDRRSELLNDVIAHAASVLKGMGLDAERAEHCGHAVADHLAEHWGGQVISFTTNCAVKLSLREREIIAAHTAGEAIYALARRYQMSESGIRKLLRRVAQRGGIDRQPALF